MQFRSLCGCFKSDRLFVGGEENTSAVGGISENIKPVYQHFSNMTEAQKMQEMQEKIEKLEKMLQVKEQEIVDLRSQLDKFQSVLFKRGETSFGGGAQTRVRKQRAQGISAEPQTIHDLSQKKFQTYPKNDR